MAKPAELEGLTAIASRFGAFVAERHPFALAVALEAFEAACGGRDPNGEAAIDALRPALRRSGASCRSGCRRARSLKASPSRRRA